MQVLKHEPPECLDYLLALVLGRSRCGPGCSLLICMCLLVLIRVASLHLAWKDSSLHFLQGQLPLLPPCKVVR